MQIKGITIGQVVLQCIGVHSILRSLVVEFIVEPQTQTSQVSFGTLAPGCEVETLVIASAVKLSKESQIKACKL